VSSVDWVTPNPADCLWGTNMLSRRIAIVVATISVVAAGCGSASPARPAGSGSTGEPSAGSSQGASPSSTTAIASPTAHPSARSIQVTGVTVSADPVAPVGDCPLEITFKATITAVGDGDVSYRWLSSDGDVSAMKSVVFKGASAMTVSADWTVDAKTLPTHAGWSTIELVNPTPGSSAAWPEATPAPFAFTCSDDNDIEAIGFGIGGSDEDCSIAKHLDTFDPTDHIRMVADWWPSLVAGTKVTFSLTRDGVTVKGYPATFTYAVSTKCVHGNVSTANMLAGTYRLDIEPDTARAISGTFDVR
jgi:hypothetical protein